MQDLISENIEIQCLAIEQLSDVSTIIAEQSVKALETTNNPFLIAERIVRLGTIIVTPLEKFIEQEIDDEKKVLASIVLLKLGSQKGLDNIITEVRKKGENEYLAINSLVESNIPNVDDLIIERLRQFSLEEFQNVKTSIFISNLFSYLKRLEVSVPEDIKGSIEKIKNSEAYKYYIL